MLSTPVNTVSDTNSTIESSRTSKKNSKLNSRTESPTNSSQSLGGNSSEKIYKSQENELEALKKSMISNYTPYISKQDQPESYLLTDVSKSINFISNLQKVIAVNEKSSSETTVMKYYDSYPEQSAFIALADHTFGNFVIQRLLDLAVPADRVIMAEQLAYHIKTLINSQFGSRVIQKALLLCGTQFALSVRDEIYKNCVELSKHQHATLVVQRLMNVLEGVKRINRIFLIASDKKYRTLTGEIGNTNIVEESEIIKLNKQESPKKIEQSMEIHEKNISDSPDIENIIEKKITVTDQKNIIKFNSAKLFIFLPSPYLILPKTYLQTSLFQKLIQIHDIKVLRAQQLSEREKEIKEHDFIVKKDYVKKFYKNQNKISEVYGGVVPDPELNTQSYEIEFIISELSKTKSVTLAVGTHRFGCRVIQKLIDEYDYSFIKPIVDNLTDDLCMYTDHCYGNYLIASVLKNLSIDPKKYILTITANISGYSINKFSSNVVEQVFKASMRYDIYNLMFNNPEKVVDVPLFKHVVASLMCVNLDLIFDYQTISNTDKAQIQDCVKISQLIKKSLDKFIEEKSSLCVALSTPNITFLNVLSDSFGYFVICTLMKLSKEIDRMLYIYVNSQKEALVQLNNQTVHYILSSITLDKYYEHNSSLSCTICAVLKYFIALLKQSLQNSSTVTKNNGKTVHDIERVAKQLFHNYDSLEPLHPMNLLNWINTSWLW